MGFAALIAAFEGESGAVDALLPLAGASLIERQARLLGAVGVERIVVIGDPGAAPLAHELARLRGLGIAIQIVGNLGDAADRIGTDERVLLLADGCLPAAALVEQLATAPSPTIAVVDDVPAYAAFERIDAVARWAGVALIDGERISATAAMIGEWDPVSTLLRRAVQENAARITVAQPPLLARDRAAFAGAGTVLIAATRPRPRGWAERWIEAPIADRALPWLLEWGADARALGWGAVGLAWAGALAAVGGARWPALLPILVAGPLAAIARRMAAVRALVLRDEGARRVARRMALAVAALGFGAGLMRTDAQWGWLLLALTLCAALGATSGLRQLLRRLAPREEPVWSARAGGLPWLLAAFAIGGAWGAGFLALTLYALATSILLGIRVDEAIGQDTTSPARP